jgi:putative ABC transport system permease protein
MSSARDSKLRAFAAKVRGFLRGRRQDGEFDEEMQEHLRRLAERFVGQGMPRKEAAAAARRQFGNLTLLKEDHRGLQTFLSLEELWRDLRYALRALWKNRGFAVVSIATLGLGIGAATAIFSVIDNVLLAPFPYKDSGRLVFARVHNTQQGEEGGRQGYTPTEFLEFAETNHVFDGITAAAEDLVLYKHGEGTEQLYGAHVTPGTFEFFGMQALHGRVLQPTDYEPGAPPVFVMRYRTWIERFNGDLSILNSRFELNGTGRTLVGIMPARFGWYDADVWFPEKPTRSEEGFAESPEIWFLLGRLKPKATSQQAQADLTVIANRLAKIHPQDYPAHFTVQVRKLGDTVVGRFQATLYTVLGAVGLLLLIACSNVANLMLARATTREKEFALRAVLGAGRMRLLRLLMVEGLVLALGGAMLGIFLAWGGLKLLVAAMPQNLIPTESVIELNGPVLTFTLCIAVLTALMFGLAPALQSSRRDLNDPLRGSGKGTSGGSQGGWLRDAVVVTEVALSLTLLIGAGLLMRSFVALRGVQLGLRADHVFQALLPLPADRYKTTEQVSKFVRPLLARMQALPGVVDAAVSSDFPPFGLPESKIDIAGRTHQEEWQTLFQQVSGQYFLVLRIEFKEGRKFSDAEISDARKVAVVNETFARKYLPNEDPIGRRMRLAVFDKPAGATRESWFEIIGVVADVRNRGLEVPIEPQVWLPYTIGATGTQALMVRTLQDPATIMNAVRREVWAVDSGVALAFPSTLEDRISERLYAGPRFGFVVMAIFGCIGTILVTVGVYSVMAYSTTQKTREIGIRMALGAEGGDVLGMVVKKGLRVVAGGMAIGLAFSLMLGKLIETQFVGVATYDPLTLAATTLLLTMTAAIACWIPARKAARVDPMVALRYE